MSTTPELPPPLPPQQRDGCLTALMIIIGIILLLPGLCSLVFIFSGLVKSAGDVQFVASCLIVGALGAALMWWAIRGNWS
jgi:hypothetical protein